jgi:predicted RNase H-like nuclease
MAGTQKMRMKKSSESIVQPRNAAKNVCRCGEVSLPKFVRTAARWSAKDEDIAGSIADRIGKGEYQASPGVGRSRRKTSLRERENSAGG